MSYGALQLERIGIDNVQHAGVLSIGVLKTEGRDGTGLATLFRPKTFAS